MSGLVNIPDYMQHDEAAAVAYVVANARGQLPAAKWQYRVTFIITSGVSSS